MYNKNDTGIIIPTVCPVCKTKLIKTDVRLYCPNESCGGREYKRIEKWIKKLDVKGFGPKLLEHLHSNGFVTSIPDFYKVDMDEVLDSTNLKKATIKAFDNLYTISEVSLATFIGGLDIDGIGEGVVDFVVEAGYDTLDKIIEADLGTINGIGPDRAERLDVGLQEMETTIDELLNYIKIKEPEKEEKIMASEISGKNFCFTGKLNNMTRADAEMSVLSRGGKFVKSINKDTDYLVTNTPDSGTSKNTKAIEVGTKIITEEQFLKLAGIK